MPIETDEEKIAGSEVTTQNIKLAEVLTQAWCDRKIISITRESHDDIEYWTLEYEVE